jgi:hypothetical protein
MLHRDGCMHRIARGLLAGTVGGIAGIAVMEGIRRATAPLRPERASKPTDVFLTERSIALIGPHHEPGEDAPAAIGRLAYQKLVGRPPSPKTKSALSWAVHLTYGLLVASLYGAIRSGGVRHAVRDGLAFGASLWLFGDELAVPLLGLSDKPSAYPPISHATSLAQHLGFGIATAAATRTLEEHL